jgi:hypothetical protein
LRTRLLILCAALASAAPLHASYVYLADSANEFGTLNLATGVFSLIGVQPNPVDGMGFAPSGIMYGMLTDPGTNDPAQVYEIDPLDATLTLLGTVLPSVYGAAIGADGLLYAVSGDDFAIFYSVDPTGPSAHTINGNLGFGVDGLAVMDGGQFYTMSNITPTLDRIDPVSGVLTPVGDSGVFIETGGVVNGIFYGIATDNSNVSSLYTVDPTTGATTLLMTITGMSSGAYPTAFAAAPVPEPSAFWLAAVCLLLPVFRRYKNPVRSRTLPPPLV